MKEKSTIKEEKKIDSNKLETCVKGYPNIFSCYNYDVNSNNSNKNLSKKFYYENFIMSAILEAFLFKNEITFKELNKNIANYIPKWCRWKITIEFQNLIILKMIRLDLIEKIDTNKNSMPKFKITKKGIDANQMQTFQNLASSSFFNYQTFNLSKRANIMNILMLIVTIMSIVVTIITITKPV